ncbi:hypothetical protein [Nocardia blacklockiae]|uniref:hypothetical protein n=1 Tax=Nocardia blacklockiae TaxID=480036 RepID=UPI001893D3A2|nr:hypothetical protein [Nocardia blacklockiae]MBF6171123.1 hypothetical protein [Nocardia blacklockiae]
MLAYLLAVVSLRRAAKQIQARRDARARIPDGDVEKLTRHAADVASARQAAETRLQGLHFGMPREDIAAALVDAAAWCEESPIARAALDRLTDHYIVEYGLVIGQTGMTLDIDPDYPADHVQTALDETATWFRQQAAREHAQSLITATPLPSAERAQITDLITDWSGGDYAKGALLDSATLTPEAIAARRSRLETRIDATALSPGDKSQLLFYVDYLTGRAGTPSGIDLLGTPPWPRPTTAPSPPYAAGPPPQQFPPGPSPYATAAPIPAPAPQPAPPPPPAPRPAAPTARGAGIGSSADGYDNAPPSPLDGTHEPGAPQPPHRPAGTETPAPAPGPAPTLGEPVQRPHPASSPPQAPTAQPQPADADTDTSTQQKISDLLDRYLDDVTTAHAHAADLAADVNSPITDDMLTLVDRMREHRHRLLDMASRSPDLADIERTQIRAILYDIDVGNTTPPPLLWVDDTAKKQADREIQRARARDLRAATLDSVTETLTAAGVLGSDPASGPDAIREPVRTAVQALIEVAHGEPVSDDDQREQFAAAEAELARHLADAGVPDAIRGQISHFARHELPTERHAQPSNAFARMTELLAGTDVLTSHARAHVDPARLRTMLTSLGDTIEAVATGNGNVERHRRRYGSLLGTFTSQLADAGVAADTRDRVHATIRHHAGLAGALARQHSDRATKWAERAVTLPSTASARDAGPAATVSNHQHHNPSTPTPRPYTSQQRRRQFWRARQRPKPTAARAHR